MRHEGEREKEETGHERAMMRTALAANHFIDTFAAQRETTAVLSCTSVCSRFAQEVWARARHAKGMHEREMRWEFFYPSDTQHQRKHAVAAPPNLLPNVSRIKSPLSSPPPPPPLSPSSSHVSSSHRHLRVYHRLTRTRTRRSPNNQAGFVCDQKIGFPRARDTKQRMHSRAVREQRLRPQLTRSAPGVRTGLPHLRLAILP